MTVSSYSRHPDLRYLYNSHHKIKNDKIDLIGAKEMKQIDEGWKYFWKRRGKVVPPKVGTRFIGDFDIIYHTKVS